LDTLIPSSAELAGDPALRNRLGMAGSLRVRKCFTEDAIKLAVGGLYRSLLSA